jgi:hypothetical protein
MQRSRVSLFDKLRYLGAAVMKVYRFTHLHAAWSSIKVTYLSDMRIVATGTGPEQCIMRMILVHDRSTTAG